jgi:hypothetical protein
MKPISLAFFFLIIFSALSFALIYVLWKDFVESNPIYFVAGLVGLTTIGMVGMLYNIIFNSTAESPYKG